jgi:trans-2,3-dihydro-3-hydroxyanthranilate isomerase
LGSCLEIELIVERESMNSLRSYRYRLMDVFTTQALEGNQLAVFPHASGIDDVTMQKIAREMNLAETAFVFPASRKDCAVAVRIFTPSQEMVFAGHPTVGTGFVLLEEGIVPENSERFVLEEKVGPVPVRVEPGEPPMIWLTTPPIRDGRCYDRSLCAEVLGLDVKDLLDITPQLLSAGNPTVLIALRSKEAVDRAWLDLRGAKTLMGTDPEPICVFVFTPTPQGAYSRMFAPEHGVVEDPATGSSTGPLAAFMMRHGLVSSASGTRFISEQGTKMGRRSILHVEIHGERGADGIEVGGYVTPVAEATMSLRMD